MEFSEDAEPPPNVAEQRQRRIFSATLIAILVFAAIVRLLYLLRFRATDPLYGYLLHDARLYDEWARALVEGRAFSEGAFYQAPGYPYFVALLYRLFGPHPVVGYVVQSLMGLGTILLVRRIAARAYGARAGLFAAALAALYGAYPFYETKLLSATAALFLSALVIERLQAADASERLVSWGGVGLIAGVSCLMRPNMLLLLPLVVAWLLFERGRSAGRWYRQIAAFVLAAGLTVLPVTVRNYLASGEWVLISSNGGLTLYHGNNPEADGRFSAPGMSGSIFKQRDESRALAEAASGRTLTDGQVSRYWFDRALAFVRSDPAAYLVLEARKAFLSLDDYEHGLEYDPQLDSNPIRRIMPVSFALLFALAVIRGFGPWRISRAETPIVLLLIVQATTLLLFYAAGRYRLPMTVPFLVLAGYGASELLDALRSDRRRLSRLLVAAVVAGTISLVKLGPDGASSYRAMSAGAVADIGLAYHRTGDHERSVEFYREAAARDPDYVYAHLDIARPLRELDRREEAEVELRRAVELAPEFADAWFELGVVLLEMNRSGDAAPPFAEAFRLDPTHAAAGSNLVGSLLESGRRAEAIEVWRQMKSRDLEVHAGLDEWMQRNVGR